MLEDREPTLKASLESRDNNWLKGLAHCKQSFRLMTYELISSRTLLETLAKRQRELTKSNAKILDWAIKTISNKKKVSLPQIRISDCVPYTVVPPGETNPILPFLNLNPDKEGPSKPCKEPSKNKAPGVIEKKELTPV